MLEAAQKCTKVLLAHGKIREEQRAVYIYGFELLFSTLICVGSMLLLAAFAGCLKRMAVFLLYFFPIRIAAGGYHAKSYRNCFFLTNGIAAVCVAASGFLQRYGGMLIETALLGGVAGAAAVIWKKAPVIPERYRHKTSRYRINRKYAHVILGMELIILLLNFVLYDRDAAYTAAVTTYAVAIMMQIAKKGEV